jgi:1-acyl-sn-glycerol-3-phosphate acyltransferase
MKALRAAFLAALRLLRVLAHVVQGYCTIKFKFEKASAAQRQAHVQQWAAGFCAILGVQLHVKGDAQIAHSQGLLLVSNHISWLDILVLLAVRPVRFVSKSEVAHWPLLGMMATGAGTLYIERASKRDAMRVMHQMADALRSGDCVGVFPEGTTGDGTTLLPFHANLLQAGVSAQVPALPVVMAFIDPSTGDISQAASYLADDTLASSMWKLLSTQGIEVRLQFLPLHASQALDRRAWAQALRADMVTAHAELIL